MLNRIHPLLSTAVVLRITPAFLPGLLLSVPKQTEILLVHTGQLGSETTVEILPPAKAMTSEKIIPNTASY